MTVLFCDARGFTARSETLDAAGTLAYLGERLARYKLPERIAFVQELPRNTSGKVIRATLIKQLEEADKTPQ